MFQTIETNYYLNRWPNVYSIHPLLYWNGKTTTLTTRSSLAASKVVISLRWRHNERNGVSNPRRLYCFLNRLYRRRSTSNIKAPRPVDSPHKGPVMQKMFQFDVLTQSFLFHLNFHPYLVPSSFIWLTHYHYIISFYIIHLIITSQIGLNYPMCYGILSHSNPKNNPEHCWVGIMTFMKLYCDKFIAYSEYFISEIHKHQNLINTQLEKKM